jgi:FkbM family methyltransferase
MNSGRDAWFLWHRFPSEIASKSKLFEYVSSDNPELRFLCRYLKPGMTFVDVGAYHGLFSILAAKKVGPSGRVVSFEPSSRDRARLRVNKALNVARRIHIEPLAIAAESGWSSFFVVLSGYTTMNSLRPPAVDTPVSEVRVESVRLDDYLSRTERSEVHLIKIDAEGAEPDIFSGAARTIQSLRPMIMCEVLDSVARPWGRVGLESIDYLKRRGYRWFEFSAQGYLRPHVTREEYPEVRNYLAVPEEKLASLADLLR